MAALRLAYNTQTGAFGYLISDGTVWTERRLAELPPHKSTKIAYNPDRQVAALVSPTLDIVLVDFRAKQYLQYGNEGECAPEPGQTTDVRSIQLLKDNSLWINLQNCKQVRWRGYTRDLCMSERCANTILVHVDSGVSPGSVRLAGD